MYQTHTRKENTVFETDNMYPPNDLLELYTLSNNGEVTNKEAS